MSDYIKYRFPNQDIVEKTGLFSEIKLDELDKGFFVSSFQGDKTFSFTENNSDFHFHLKSDRPEVYTEKEYLFKASEFLNRIKVLDLKKAIFSRVKCVDFDTSKIEELFSKLEESYPNSLVYLISSKLFGTWIGASPEILLESENEISKTISLAGTKTIDDDSGWTEKEILEQNYVTEFIESKLQKIGLSELNRSETIEISAGPVKHLRTEFSWVKNSSKEKQILKELHPTPAVSGYPRQEALKLISEIETHERELYSGMIGYLDGNSTSVYVNLRCCQIQSNNAYLYLGGGFTMDSDINSEWQETENKSKTLLNIIEKL